MLIARSASIVGRILKRARSLSICRPTKQAKIELFLNLKAARALGREHSLCLLARADEVIE